LSANVTSDAQLFPVDPFLYPPRTFLQHLSLRVNITNTNQTSRLLFYSWVHGERFGMPPDLRAMDPLRDSSTAVGVLLSRWFEQSDLSRRFKTLIPSPAVARIA